MTPLLLLLGCTNKAAPPAHDDGGTDCTPLLAWRDGDGDGFGAGEAVASCTRPPGHAAQDGDCDDGDPSVHPGRTDDCDGRDQDCDGLADEDGAALNCYWDADQDGHGVDSARFSTRCACPEGYATVLGDCDDLDPEIHPGALEQWYDGVDQDCASDDDFDADGDGHAINGGPADCDDADPTVHPEATEICRNGIDDDCDGLPGRCETVGEVSRADATAILVGDDDATLYILGTSIASPTEPGKRQVVLQQQGPVGTGRKPEDPSEVGYKIVDLQPGVFGSTELRTAATLRGAGWEDWGYAFHAAGGADLDGDGNEELAMAWADSDTDTLWTGEYSSTVFLLSGPLVGEVLLDDQPQAHVPVDEGTALLGGSLHLVDSDGEGSFTLVIPLWTFQASTGYPLARFLDEGHFRGEGSVSDAPTLWQAASEPKLSYGSKHMHVGDINGDGLADLLWYWTTGTDQVSRMILGPLDHDRFADEADAGWPNEVSGEKLLPEGLCQSTDTDGRILLSAGDFRTHRQTLFLFDGATEGMVDESDAISRVEFDVLFDTAAPRPCGWDMDGDGWRELLVTVEPADHSTDWSAVQLLRLPASGVWSSADLLQVDYLVDPTTTGYFTISENNSPSFMPPADLDGDGFHDLVFHEPYDSDTLDPFAFSPSLLFFPGGNGGL